MYMVYSQMMPPLGFPAIQPLQVIKFAESMTQDEKSTTEGLAQELFEGFGVLKEPYEISMEPLAIPFFLCTPCTPRRIPIPLCLVLKSKLDRLETWGIINGTQT